ncbi:hypothetical protein WEI85_04985 [Actinomycetes bacterium KLBMP 9797]
MKDATYELRQEREWLVRVAPYVNFVLNSLRLVVPVAAAVAGVVLPKPDLEGLSSRIELMKIIADKLPSDIATRGRGAEPRTDGNMTTAEGAALRAFRVLLFRHDPTRAFGDLRRVQSPSGDLLWVCPEHHREYDPGLPAIPEQQTPT